MVRGVVFDFDLTLVDSAVGICGNLNALAEEKGLPRLKPDEVRGTIGWALADAMRHFWGEGPVETDWIPRYRKLFESRGYAGVSPYPDTVPALLKLVSAGIRLGIATNRLMPEGIVRAAGLYGYFPVIVGIENLRPKPAPDIVAEALRQMGVPPSQALYVGDTDIDMKTAVASGVVGVGVTTGNHDEKYLKESGARYVISGMNELPALVEAINEKMR